MHIQREIKNSVQDIMTKYPVFALTGPRQSGKITLLKTAFPNFRYVSLENPDNRNFAESDPHGFLKLYDKHVIFMKCKEFLHYFHTFRLWFMTTGKWDNSFYQGLRNFI